MGLYSSFDTSQYYDEPSKPVKTEKKVTKIKQPHKVSDNYNLTSQKRKSLYEESQKIKEKGAQYPKVDFRELYRVGQMIIVQSPDGKIRTRRGRIVEIVEKDLMYVGMEDTYKDVQDQWLVDFVTAKDIIKKI